MSGTFGAQARHCTGTSLANSRQLTIIASQIRYLAALSHEIATWHISEHIPGLRHTGMDNLRHFQLILPQST